MFDYKKGGISRYAKEFLDRKLSAEDILLKHKSLIDQARDLDDNNALTLENIYATIMFFHDADKFNKLQVVLKDFVDDVNNNTAKCKIKNIATRANIKKMLENAGYDIQNNINPFEIFLTDFADALQQNVRATIDDFLETIEEPKKIQTWQVAQHISNDRVPSKYLNDIARRNLGNPMKFSLKTFDDALYPFYFDRMQLMFVSHIISSLGLAITPVGMYEYTEEERERNFNNGLVSLIYEENDKQRANQKIIDFLINHINEHCINLSHFYSKHINQLEAEKYFNPIVKHGDNVYMMFNDESIPDSMAVVNDQFEYISLMSNFYYNLNTIKTTPDDLFERFHLLDSNAKRLHDYIHENKTMLSPNAIATQCGDISIFGDGSLKSKREFVKVMTAGIDNQRIWQDILLNVLECTSLREEEYQKTQGLYNLIGL